MSNLKEIKELYQKKLISIYNSNEISIFIEMILEKEFSISRNEILVNPEKKFEKKQEEKLLKILNRLGQNEPIQHILEEADFYGLKFRVNKNTLIPRGETEELLEQIIKDNKLSNLKVLDIGTGSGCIAIALAKNINNAQIYALDISGKALEMAKINAEKNKVEVHFIEFDILKWRENSILNELKFDIIVSNPPYIRKNEKILMRKNVLDYEPNSALFVENDNALIFYTEIANFAQQYLTKNGKLYFEINEAFGKETNDLLTDKGFQNIIIYKDLNGKDRFSSANLPNG